MLLNHIASLATLGKKRRFEELHPILLALFGAPSFLVASYYGLKVTAMIPVLMSAAEEAGFTGAVVVLWLIAGAFSLGVWLFGCVASRCHKLLYDHWFK